MSTLKNKHLIVLKGFNDLLDDVIVLSELNDLLRTFDTDDCDSEEIMEELSDYGYLKKKKYQVFGDPGYRITDEGVEYIKNNVK